MPLTEPDGHSSELAAFSQPSLPLRLLDHGALDLYRQCEQLVVIAVDAAQRAEETFHRAREALRATRRRSVLGGAFGVLGLVAGLSAVVDNHFHARAATERVASTTPATAASLPAVAAAAPAITTEQVTSAAPPAPVSPPTVAEAPAATEAPPATEAPAKATPETPLPTLHATYVPSLPLPPRVAPPRADTTKPTESRTATYVPAAPWPSAHPAGFSRVSVRRPVLVMPPFVGTLRRNVAMLFGG
jgi:hypothetical protein